MAGPDRSYRKGVTTLVVTARPWSLTASGTAVVRAQALGSLVLAGAEYRALRRLGTASPERLADPGGRGRQR